MIVDGLETIRKLESRVKLETVEQFLARGGSIKKVKLKFELRGSQWRSNFAKWKLKAAM